MQAIKTRNKNFLSTEISRRFHFKGRTGKKNEVFYLRGIHNKNSIFLLIKDRMQDVSEVFVSAE